eukprot:GHRQ01038797.1.p4 GENE.GHRQ01038797.1~~GHRQ01038797.1.p4  ORF type:complete len:101 (+),score=12.41 GHRQ01038797.1:483-785(+)
MRSAWLVLAVLLLAVSAAPSAAYQKGSWINGRATFYGGTESLVQAYKARGIESFGIIEHGSCGYTLSDGTLAYKRDMYAALAGGQAHDILVYWLPASPNI